MILRTNEKKNDYKVQTIEIMGLFRQKYILEPDGKKKSKVRKFFLETNKQFFEGLGLKVKHSLENW